MLRRWVQQLRDPSTQFRVLFRVFLMRVVDLELLSANGDTTRLVGQFMTIFSSISLMFALPVVLIGAMSQSARWTAEHFFIATTMTAVGVLTVLSWDSAFPDRQDVLVLAPLPVRSHTLFLAKVAALLAAPALTVLALNVFSGLAWPLLFVSMDHGKLGSLRAWPAYWISVSAAGAFVVLSILALQGLAANLLPRQHFLRLSAFLQAGTLCLLLSLYFLEPSLETPKALTSPENQRVLAWLPAYWFLGLFQQVNGSMHPALAPLARRAWVGLAVSAIGAGAALLLSYFRTLPKIIEQPEILPGTRSFRGVPIPGGSLQNAITVFTLRTLLRSRQHRMILSFYLGIGLAILVGYVKTPLLDGQRHPGGGIPPSLLMASVLIQILALLALRVVVTLPISLKANWMVRITQVSPARSYRQATRVSWIVAGVAPVWIITAILLLVGYPWKPALGHLAVLLLLGMGLVEICLSTFRKISFTCSYLPGKANIHFVFWATLMVLIRLLYEGAKLEGRLLQHLQGSAVMILVLAAAVAGGWVWSEHAAGTEQELQFEEEYPVDIVSLNLR